MGKLVDRRLLRSDQRADSTYYELSHDMLIEAVLATRRVKDRFLGLLTACAGALVLLLTAVFLLLGLGTLYLHLAYVYGMLLHKNFPREHPPNFYLTLAILYLVFFLPPFVFLELSWVAELSEHSTETAQVAEEKGSAYFSDPKGRVASPNSAS